MLEAGVRARRGVPRTRALGTGSDARCRQRCMQVPLCPAYSFCACTRRTQLETRLTATRNEAASMKARADARRQCCGTQVPFCSAYSLLRMHQAHPAGHQADRHAE